MKKFLLLLIFPIVFLSSWGKNPGLEILKSIDLTKQPFTYTLDYKSDSNFVHGRYNVDPLSKTASVELSGTGDSSQLNLNADITEKDVVLTMLREVEGNEVTTLDDVTPDITKDILESFDLTPFDTLFEFFKDHMSYMESCFEEGTTFKDGGYQGEDEVIVDGKVYTSSLAYISEDGHFLRLNIKSLYGEKTTFTMILQ